MGTHIHILWLYTVGLSPICLKIKIIIIAINYNLKIFKPTSVLKLRNGISQNQQEIKECLKIDSITVSRIRRLMTQSDTDLEI